jgi:hypothetical protein
MTGIDMIVAIDQEGLELMLAVGTEEVEDEGEGDTDISSSLISHYNDSHDVITSMI